ncbi:hypothetical protein L7750_19160 [Xenorhabdus bovienii]|uniref:hypothetical protein n=1 Tax=Xenorhabdus bovienii TaxID=40576 RepID=UPI001EDDE556|nr:hypothetical protein [Xenorhabdus bovienii]MCG3460477.1 hypothetical protein [Xenorhabdus bovienii]MCG3472409.1 hypothetical protein [Xenorhabdus bovienii]
MWGQTVAGLPVGHGVGGGKWAMAGLSYRVPNQSVQAVQSPFNIMWGNYTPLTGQLRCPNQHRTAVRSV